MGERTAWVAAVALALSAQIGVGVSRASHKSSALDTFELTSCGKERMHARRLFAIAVWRPRWLWRPLSAVPSPNDGGSA